MGEFKRVVRRFLPCLGLQLTRPVDELDPGKFPILSNIRSYRQGIIQARPGLLALGAPIAGIPHVHSVRRLNDPATADYTRVVGAGTSLYAGKTNFPSPVVDLLGNTSIGLAYTGLPMSMVPFRPAKSPQSWMYVGDGNQMSKVRVDGKAANIGVAPPLTAPAITLGIPRFQVIEDFRTSPLLWDTCGVPVPPVLNRVKRVDDAVVAIDHLLYDSGTTGWATVSIPAVGMTSIGPGTLIDVLGANPENNVKVFSVQRTPINSGASAVIGGIVYDSTGTSAGTGYCTIVPTVPITDIVPNAIIDIGGTESVRVAAIDVGEDGSISFECVTVNNHVAGESLVGVPSFRCYFSQHHVVTDPVRSWAYETLTPTPGTNGSWLTISNPPPDPPRNNCGNATAGLLTMDLTSVPGAPRRQIQPGDKIHISVLVSDVADLTEGIVYFDVDSQVNDFSHNFYVYNFGPADLIPSGNSAPTVPQSLTTAQQRELALSVQLPAASTDLSPGAFQGQDNAQPGLGQTASGSSQWTELVFTVGQLTRVGADHSRGLANVRRVGILFGYTAVETLAISSFWIGGTYGPDSFGGGEYFYRFRARSNSTGVQSLPSPPTHFGLEAHRDDILITPTYVTDPQVDSTQQGVLVIERFGGSLDSWREVGSVPNLSTGPAAFDDIFPDSTIVAAPVGDETNFQPFPTIDLPRNGMCNVVGDRIIWVSGDLFDTRMPPGTSIEVNGVFYTFYTSPIAITSLAPNGDFVEIQQNAGIQNNVRFSIPQGIIQGRALPILFGPVAQTGQFFALGDLDNPGTIYWTNPQDPDSADDANNQELTGPSEPLINGLIFGESRPVVFTGEQVMALFPQEGGTWRVQLVTNKIGLLARYAITAGPKIWYRGKKGIYETVLGEPVSITDADLYPLFPHDGIPGETVNGFSPVDDSFLDAQRLSYDRGYVRFTYQDICGITQTIVYDTKVNGWFPDNYPNPTPQMFYDEEGKGVNSLLAGCNFGLLCQVREGSDNGAPVNCHVRTPSLDDGDPATQKQWQDAMLDLDPDGVTVNVQQGFNQHATTLAAQTVSGTGRVKKEFIDNTGGGTKGYNQSLDITWQVTDCPSEPDCPCVGGTPAITSLSPGTVVAGSGAFTLTVNGVNFRPDSVVRWNGAARATTYLSSIQLTAAILAGDVAGAGSATVTVFNPDPGCGESAGANFTISEALSAPAILGANITNGHFPTTLRSFDPFPKTPADHQNEVVCTKGSISDLVVMLNNDFDTNVDADSIFTLYVNNVATALTLTIPLTALAGVYKTTGISVPVNQGDLIRVEMTNSGAFQPDGLIGSWGVTFTADDGSTVVGAAYGYMFTGFVGSGANVGFAIAITGGGDNGGVPPFSLDDMKCPWPTAGVIKNLYIRTTATQSLTGDITVTLRKNGVDTALTVTVHAGDPAGIYNDTTHSVAVIPGDILNWHYNNAASVSAAPLSNIQAKFLPTVAGKVVVVGGPSAGSSDHPFGGTSYYFAPYDADVASGLNANGLSYCIPRAGTLQNLYAYVTPGVAPSFTATLYVNGAPTAITIIFPINAGGNYTDLTHTVAVAQGDIISLVSPTNGIRDLIGYSLEIL